MSVEDARLLGALGVSKTEERVWHALLRTPEADEELLATDTATSVRATRDALEQLAGHDLVSPAESPSGFVALDPRLSIQAKIANEQRELAERAARLAALSARLPTISAEYEVGRARVSSDPTLRVVRG